MLEFRIYGLGLRSTGLGFSIWNGFKNGNSLTDDSLPALRAPYEIPLALSSRLSDDTHTSTRSRVATHNTRPKNKYVVSSDWGKSNGLVLFFKGIHKSHSHPIQPNKASEGFLHGGTVRPRDWMSNSQFCGASWKAVGLGQSQIRISSQISSSRISPKGFLSSTFTVILYAFVWKGFFRLSSPTLAS